MKCENPVVKNTHSKQGWPCYGTKIPSPVNAFLVIVKVEEILSICVLQRDAEKIYFLNKFYLIKIPINTTVTTSNRGGTVFIRVSTIELPFHKNPVR